MATKPRRGMRLVWSNGQRISATGRATASARDRRRMKLHQQLDRDTCLAVLGRRLTDSRPVFSRNSSALPPLLNSPKRLLDRFGKVGGSAESGEDPLDVGNAVAFHATVLPSDNESGQCRTTEPVTALDSKRTMRPYMGRATTPSRFKATFCRRLRAARILANLTQAEAAVALGVKDDTYSKYERRSPMPHYLIPKACDLFRVNPDELYGFVQRPDLDMDYEDKRRA